MARITASKKNWRNRILLMGFGISMGLLLSEVTCRLFRPQVPLQSTDSLLNRGRFTTVGKHWNIQPEFKTEVEVNHFGFVDREWNLTEPPDILFIGDSFVQGAQVPMEKAIGRQLDDNLDSTVWSMGVPGAGTTTEWLLLQEWLQTVKPKKVIIGFLPSNDILNNHPALESKSDKPFVDINTINQSDVSVVMPEPTVDNYPLARHSHLWRWWLRYSDIEQQRKEKMSLKGLPRDWDVYNPAISEIWSEAWMFTGILFQQINKLCKENKVILNVILFPSIEEVSPAFREQVHQQYPDTDSWNWNLESQSLSMLEQAGITDAQILSLYPIFTNHPTPNALYYPRDKHWTITGHTLASETIQAWLESSP